MDKQGKNDGEAMCGEIQSALCITNEKEDNGLSVILINDADSAITGNRKVNPCYCTSCICLWLYAIWKCLE